MINNVIITGAAGSLGTAVVNHFLTKGAKVLATVSKGKSLGYEPTGDIEVTGIDLTKEKDVAEFVDNMVTKYKTINAAVLLVGGFSMGKMSDTDTESIRKMIALNFETAYNVVRPLLSAMQSQPEGGRIVLVGSRPAINPADGKNTIAYALSKSLVLRLAELINAEASKKNVVAHVIAPSIIDTPQNREGMPDADFEKWVKPEDIANTIYFLCSPEGALIREGVIKVYGKS